MPTLPQISLPDLSGSKKFILIGALMVIFLLVGALVLSVSLFKRVSPVTLTVWGLWEDQSVFSQVVADYQRISPNVTIRYAKQSPLNYRDRLTTATSGNNGPDVFLIHNTWLPMFKGLAAPMPATIYSPNDYKTIFYPTVSRDFITGGRAYAVPIGVDDLALYVNTDILAAAGVNPPATWDGAESFVTIAQKITVRDSAGRIKTAGAAMGTASNVDQWQDIVGLMMLQAGVNLNTDPGSQKAQDALSFYTSFANGDNKVWDETLDSSTIAFSQGKLGMYFGPSWRFFDFKSLNPNLNFKVVPVPQLAGADKINYASYWGEAVSSRSKNQTVAWNFLKFLSSKDELTKMYTAESKIRSFGEPYSRTDMANLLLADPNVGPFINAAPTAGSWYLASFTADGDTGINSRIGKYYQDAINLMLRGGDAKSAMETVAKGVAQVLANYK